MYFGVLSLHSALVYEKLNEMLFDLLTDSPNNIENGPLYSNSHEEC